MTLTSRTSPGPTSGAISLSKGDTPAKGLPLVGEKSPANGVRLRASQLQVTKGLTGVSSVLKAWDLAVAECIDEQTVVVAGDL